MNKKPYTTPTVRKVKLVAEEAVLGNCKSDISVGPNQPGMCTIPNCLTPGS